MYNGNMGDRVEAKSAKTGLKIHTILGVPVSGTSTDTVLTKIEAQCTKKAFKKPFFIVTAYSEFFLEAQKDLGFKNALFEADLVVPDGVSVVAAMDYQDQRLGVWWRDLGAGLRVGLRILKGELSGRIVVGVRLVEKILELAGEKKWRVFLLGSDKDTLTKLKFKIKGSDYLAGLVDSGKLESDPGPIRLSDLSYSDNEKLVKKVNNFKPDILLVAFGRFKQEKWIWQNLSKINARVVMGVGSSFDELSGRGKWVTPAPLWVEKMGLKWLWRVTKDPKHLRRAWNAFPVFAWKVFADRKA